MLFRKKPVIVEALTFEEFVQHGRDCKANLVNNMPWSFGFRGHAVTHESDTCYLIPTPEGVARFNKGDMLLVGVEGEIYPCKMSVFEKSYEPVGEVAE